MLATTAREVCRLFEAFVLAPRPACRAWIEWGQQIVTYTKAELAEILTIDQFPRSASYDIEWVLENQMGPNVLWLAESLAQVMALKPGMRVLDMGCGRAISSIFLAKEYDLQVWATDLWVGAGENWKRVCAAGVPEQLRPYWEWEFCSFHSPAWWRRHWEKTGQVTRELTHSQTGAG
jgi:hypothetical protein